METTFHNLTVTVEAHTAKAAYTKLCNLMAMGGPSISWTTDTYTTDQRRPSRYRPTSELFPKPRRAKS